MWVRGLKRQKRRGSESLEESHPMWVRGLKLQLTKQSTDQEIVAPYVGAWIETITTV